MRRIFLPLSIAIILAHWAAHLWALGGTVARPNVREIALSSCADTAIAIAIIWPLLRGNGERLADLGFGLRDLRLALRPGVLLAVGIFVVLNGLVGSLQAVLGGSGTSPTLIALFRNPRDAPWWILAAIVGGGFREEFVRAFCLTRFEQMFGRSGLVLAIAVHSVQFAVDHLYQGPWGAAQVGLMGLLYALIFLHRRRVADAMVVHAGYDLLAVAALYAHYA